jgi:hypothetical protein
MKTQLRTLAQAQVKKKVPSEQDHSVMNTISTGFH